MMDYLILAHGTIPLQLCEWWILEVCNAMPSEHLLWTLSSFIIPILHLRKLMFRDGTALAQSHTPNRPRSNYSAILRPCFLLGGDDGSRFYICLLTHTGISSGAKTLSLPWESLPPWSPQRRTGLLIIPSLKVPAFSPNSSYHNCNHIMMWLFHVCFPDHYESSRRQEVRQTLLDAYPISILLFLYSRSWNNIILFHKML